MANYQDTVDQSDRKVPVNLRQSGPTPTELLISTRVRKSPYWHLSHEAGCWRATVYNRIYHPRGYVRPEDGGAMVEYRAPGRARDALERGGGTPDPRCRARRRGFRQSRDHAGRDAPSGR